MSRLNGAVSRCSAAARSGARVAGRFQTGYLYTYAFVMLIGLTAAVTWAIGLY